MRKSQESELMECVGACLEEIDVTTDEVLVILTAPEYNEYSEYYYVMSLQGVQEQLEKEIRTLAEKIGEGILNVKSFNVAFKVLDTLSGYVQGDEWIRIRAYLTKLESMDLGANPGKSKKMLTAVAAKVEELEI